MENPWKRRSLVQARVKEPALFFFGNEHILMAGFESRLGVILPMIGGLVLFENPHGFFRLGLTDVFCFLVLYLV